MKNNADTKEEGKIMLQKFNIIIKKLPKKDVEKFTHKYPTLSANGKLGNSESLYLLYNYCCLCPLMIYYSKLTISDEISIC